MQLFTLHDLPNRVFLVRPSCSTGFCLSSGKCLRANSAAHRPVNKPPPSNSLIRFAFRASYSATTSSSVLLGSTMKPCCRSSIFNSPSPGRRRTREEGAYVLIHRQYLHLAPPNKSMARCGKAEPSNQSLAAASNSADASSEASSTGSTTTRWGQPPVALDALGHERLPFEALLEHMRLEVVCT